MRRTLIVSAGALVCGALSVGLAYETSARSEPSAAASELRQEMASFASQNKLDMTIITPDRPGLFAYFFANHGSSDSIARCYNLGDALFLADRLPEAILTYQHGLRLDPNDGGLRANLDYARARVSYPFGEHGRPEEDSWPPWLYRPSPFQALAVTFFLYSLVWLLGTRWFMTRRRGLVVRAAIVFVIALACGAFGRYFESEDDWQAQHPVVVVREDHLPLRKGNGPSYPTNPDLPVLSRGMEARQLHERGGWLQIQFASGEIGWVEKHAVLTGF